MAPIRASRLAIPPKQEAPAPGGPDFFVPLLGESVAILQEPIKFFEGRVRDYGPVFKTHFAGEECIAVADTALIKEVCAAEHTAVRVDMLKSSE